jgi:hypothetical protein
MSNITGSGDLYDRSHGLTSISFCSYFVRFLGLFDHFMRRQLCSKAKEKPPSPIRIVKPEGSLYSHNFGPEKKSGTFGMGRRNLFSEENGPPNGGHRKFRAREKAVV